MLTLLLGAAAAAALQPTPVGPTTLLPGDPESCGHRDPAVAFAPDGRALAVWSHASTGVRGRFVASSGALVGGELLLATAASEPALAAAPDGTFIAAWSTGSYPEEHLVWRRFDATGAPLGEQVPVGVTNVLLYPPALAALPSGVVVVVWVEVEPSRLMLRRFAADGTPLGAPRVVDSLPSPGVQEHFAEPVVAVDAAGSVLIGWLHVQGGWQPQRLRVQGYAATGEPLGEPRDLETNAFGPALASRPDGGFLAAWSTRETPAVWVQRLAADGAPVATALQVHELPQPLSPAYDFELTASRPALAAGPGWVAVGWIEATTWLADQAFALLLDGGGAPLGEPQALHPPLEELLEEGPGYYSRSLTLAAHPDGALLAAWQVGIETHVLPSGCDLGRTVMAARFVAGPAAPPPPGNWVSAPALPGYRLQARITPHTTGPLTATLLPDCLSETACFSGALRGRTEALVRVIGPRPNGRLWPSIVRFTPSQIEVWIEQEATGEVRYYQLPAVPQESDELPGLIDRFGFAP